MEKDKELIEKIQSGDSSAFAELYDRYFEKIYKFIYYKTTHKENAEDLCSQTFTKALEKISDFKFTNTGTFSAWLYRIARNTVIDFYRTSPQQQDIDQTYNLYQEDDMENKISDKQNLDSIRDKLGSLKQEQREIIVMRVWDELSYKEISEIVGKSEASCKMSFSRGIKQLKNNLISIIILIALLVS